MANAYLMIGNKHSEQLSELYQWPYIFVITYQDLNCIKQSNKKTSEVFFFLNFYLNCYEFINNVRKTTSCNSIEYYNLI